MRLRWLAAWSLAAASSVIPAFAQFSPIATPTSAYTGATTVMSIPGANFSTTNTLTDGTLTLNFSSTLSVRTVPGGGWATWNSPPATESSTPKVLAGVGLTTLTITLPTGNTIFGFEVEPNGPGTFLVTATYYNGATVLGSIPLSIPANSGALLAAASSSTPITSVVVTAPGGAGGFAMAQFRYAAAPAVAAVPALGTPALCGLALALLVGGMLLARRQGLVGG